MSARPHSSPGDVSCRATAYTIQQLGRMGQPTAHITDGLSLTLDELQVPSASVAWDDYLVFFRNAFQSLSPQALIRLCSSYGGSPYVRPLLSAAGLWFNPARYFEWVADPENGALHHMFRCLETRFVRVNEREVVVEERLRPGYAPPPDRFWEGQAIAFSALTSHFGLAPSIVAWEPVERGAAFRVRLPRRRPVRFLLSWLGSWFGRETAEDVRAALAYGHERSLRLEGEIAERRRVEAALAESEERVRRITEAIPGVVYQHDLGPDGRHSLTFVSGGSTQLLGYTPAELVASPRLVLDRIDPAYTTAVRESILESARNGTLWLQEFLFRTRSGDLRWLRGRSLPEPVHPSGRVVWNGMLADVTDQKLAEAQRRRLAEEYKNLFERAVIGVFRTTPEGRFLAANPALARILGYDTAEDVLEAVTDIGGQLYARPRERAEFIRTMDASDDSLGIECEWRRRDGTPVWVRLDARAVRGEGGRLLYYEGFLKDITERRHSEARLREREEQFREAQSIARIGSWGWEPATGRTWWSDGVFQVYGIDPAAVVPSYEAYLGCLHPDDRPTAVARARRVLAGGADGYADDLRVVRPDGAVVWVHSRGRATRDAAGALLRIEGTDQDITDRKLAEAERDRLLSQLQLHIDRMPLAYVLYDADLRYAGWNPAAEVMFEYTRDEILGRPLMTLVHPDDRDHVLATRDRLRAGDVVARCTNRNVARSGRVIVCEWHNTPLYGPGGAFTGVLSMALDVTERVRTQEALRLKEQSLQLALDAGRMGIWDWEIGSVLLAWDEREQRLFGFAAGEFDGRLDTFLSRVHPDDLPAVRHVLADAAAGKDFDGEFRIRLPTGEVRWIHGSGRVVVRTDGRPANLVGINYDVTGRRKAEAALRESEEQLRIFIQNAPAGVAMFDRDLRYVSHSRRWMSDYGLGEGSLVGRRHYEVFPEVPDRWKEIHRRCLTGVAERCEEDRFDRADGSTDYIRWEIQPWTAGGEVGGLVFFTEMVTDRVKAEKQLRTALQEKEAMLKEIHHRVKNNLQVVSSLLSLQAARANNPVATDVLTESQNRVRAMALVHETLYRSEDLARVDVARYIGELCGYLFRSFGVDSARVRLVLDVAHVTLSLDKTIPCGLLVNEIVSNSLKHAFPGTHSGCISVRLAASPADRIVLTVSDDGVGMPPEVAVEKSPTLGLQLVSVLAEQLDGTLAVGRSGGTRFTLSFAP